MLAIIHSAALDGIDGKPVRVEVHVSSGLPAFNVVGQPDAACREARDRVRAALLSSGFAWPLQRITVNLAPGSVRKVGAGFDLPIAVGLLVATGVVAADCLGDCSFIGELGLDGSLRGVPGMISMVDRAPTRAVLVPTAAGAEARVSGCKRPPVCAGWWLRSGVRNHGPHHPRLLLKAEGCPNRIWLMSEASSTAGGPSKWLPPAAITS